MNYELMVITAPGASAEPVLAKVEKSIKEAEVSNLKVEKLGKKALAYPIAKQIDGEYVLFNFEAPSETIGAVLKMLRLEREAILRYLVLRAPRVSRLSPSFANLPAGKAGATEGKQVSKGKVIVTTKTAVKTATKVTKVPQVSKVSKVSKGIRTKGKKGK